MLRRHEILAKPHWQAVAGHPVLPALPLEELRALDSLVDFMRMHGCASLTGSDCRAWARLNGGPDGLEQALRAVEATEGPDAPELGALRTARDMFAARMDYASIPREPRRAYSRTLSVAVADLPAKWQSRLEDIRARRDDGEFRLADDILERMTRKLCQYAHHMGQIGLDCELTLGGLQAFYDFETTRISNRGAPLRPSTILNTFSDLRYYMRLSGDYPADLIAEIGRLLEKLGDRAEAVVSQKYAALAKIDVKAIRPRAQDILDSVAKYTNPAQRHIRRNRAVALAIPPTTPLRREWHELRFGRDLVWADGRYRLRDYKLRKTRNRWWREPYPGSVHPDVQHFVDAVLLQDEDPKYLDALRVRAETESWPLFSHPDGSLVAENYVSQVWSAELGTGAHIARTIVYDILFALGRMRRAAA